MPSCFPESLLCPFPLGSSPPSLVLTPSAPDLFWGDGGGRPEGCWWANPVESQVLLCYRKAFQSKGDPISLVIQSLGGTSIDEVPLA